MVSSVKYWLWFALKKSIPLDLAHKLYHGFGSSIERLYLATEESLQYFDLTQTQISQLLSKNLKEAQDILDSCQKLGIQILTFQDSLYPRKLRSITEPPLLLYAKGTMPRIDDCLSVGIVGAREASTYGICETIEMALSLCKATALVVTGMAEGIDSAALEGALKAGGTVVSVVAGGIDCPYPVVSTGFYQDVPQVGVILSEYPPGTSHKAYHFRPRNRIICGISDGVFVPECKATGGSMMSARIAQEQQRDIFALPHHVKDPLGTGPHLLIQEHGAHLVTNASDILHYYSYLYPLQGYSLSPEEIQARVAESASHVPTKKTKSSKSPGKKRKMPKKNENPQSLEALAEGLSGIYTEPEPVQGSNSQSKGKTDQTFEHIPKNKQKSRFTDDQLMILSHLAQGVKSVDILVEETNIPTKRVVSALTLLEMDGKVQDKGNGRFDTQIRLD